MLKYLLATLLLLPACARQAEHDPDAPPPDIRNAEVTIIVNNQHWLDINIYLIRGTLGDRIGTATANSSKIFSLPWTRVGGSSEIRLRGDPIGQPGALYTEHISVRPGSVVEWTVGTGMRQSNVAVY